MSKKADKVIQSVIVKKKYAPQLNTALAWVQSLHLKTDSIDEKVNTWRFRQHDPSFFLKNSFKMYHIGHGIMAAVATPKKGVFAGLSVQELR